MSRREKRREAALARKVKTIARSMSPEAFRVRCAVWLMATGASMIRERRKDDPAFVWTDEDVLALLDVLGVGIRSADPAQIDRVEVTQPK